MDENKVVDSTLSPSRGFMSKNMILSPDIEEGTRRAESVKWNGSGCYARTMMIFLVS